MRVCTAPGGGVYFYWWGCVLLLVGVCTATGGVCTATGGGVYWWGCVLVGACTVGGVYAQQLVTTVSSPPTTYLMMLQPENCSQMVH